MMESLELKNLWNYYLELQKDLADSSRYIEPAGQENVYSFEFRKIIILACTEVETAFKALCEEIDASHSRGNMDDYREVITAKYPRIIDAVTTIPRWHESIKPFENWDTGSLFWWKAHQLIKHDRGSNFAEATYKNAVYALSALYILILYLAETTNIEIASYASGYISSDYCFRVLTVAGDKKLPDFECLNN